MDEIISTIGRPLQEAALAFFIPLQTERVVNRAAFEELEKLTKMLAKELKPHELIPKRILNDLYASIRGLQNEAPYFRAEGAVLLEMANRLDSLTTMILMGETPEDRVPGVPRIV